MVPEPPVAFVRREGGGGVGLGRGGLQAWAILVAWSDDGFTQYIPYLWFSSLYFVSSGLYIVHWITGLYCSRGKLARPETQESQTHQDPLEPTHSRTGLDGLHARQERQESLYPAYCRRPRTRLQVLMRELHLGRVSGKVLDSVAVARHEVTVSNETLQPHRAAWRHHGCRNANLRSKAVPEPVGESARFFEACVHEHACVCMFERGTGRGRRQAGRHTGREAGRQTDRKARTRRGRQKETDRTSQTTIRPAGDVPVNTGGVHLRLEVSGGGRVLGYYAISVARPVRVDVCHRLGHVLDDLCAERGVMSLLAASQVRKTKTDGSIAKLNRQAATQHAVIVHARTHTCTQNNATRTHARTHAHTHTHRKAGQKNSIHKCSMHACMHKNRDMDAP